MAAYMIATSNRAWVQSHIASVITFDSPLQGFFVLTNFALGVIGKPCTLLDPSVRQMSFNDPVVAAARTAGSRVPFFTINAVGADLSVPLIDPVPSYSTHISGEWAHITYLQSHADVWRTSDPGLPWTFTDPANKKRFVACGVIAARSCPLQ